MTKKNTRKERTSKKWCSCGYKNNGENHEKGEHHNKGKKK